ncbi:grasp-with-spasm system ATP-grasp peptide maturase [Flavobacterium sp. '19STA2R22 D10 B1']|uniref:grasp-with-spasm system ATP-grasp peptide maturase n=1 Tax=Flavobacterium aerium TaxID=3037261 RepID=UPI00278C8CFA|nr:grasp-with-spasm system ATP-grasp peptide maturase [Flavobacterium sp. '19STA2R22 D10 B1']
MVIIFSETTDLSTNQVIDWLIFNNTKYIRYNEAKSYYKQSLLDKSYSYKIGDNIFDHSIENSNQIKSIWFRRPYKGINDMFEIIPTNGLIPFKKLESNLKNHYTILKNLIINSLLKYRTLGSYETIQLNKPIVLSIAKNVGLKIPNTIITNDYKELRRFYIQNNNKIITKALSESFRFDPPNEGHWISNKTVLIQNINQSPKKFATSLFQEYIEKKYELRVFYLNDKIFCSCIFSQLNTKTKIDFRNYDKTVPNRIVPYNLPSDIIQKIIRLMKILNLNTGSIDLLKSHNDEYIFLEVNPVGQFGFISESCNFYLEKEITNYLTNDRK